MTFQFLGNPWMMKLLKRINRKIDVRFLVLISRKICGRITRVNPETFPRVLSEDIPDESVEQSRKSFGE